MSADNYWYVGKHGVSFYVAMGFASNEAYPGLRRALVFSRANEAINHAVLLDSRDPAEYGVVISQEVLDIVREGNTVKQKWIPAERDERHEDVWTIVDCFNRSFSDYGYLAIVEYNNASSDEWRVTIECYDEEIDMAYSYEDLDSAVGKIYTEVGERYEQI